MQSVKNFNIFVEGMNIKKIPVDESIAMKAAELRAKYQALKALDSIHLATAILSHCKAFITNDKQLQQIKEVSVYSMEILKN